MTDTKIPLPAGEIAFPGTIYIGPNQLMTDKPKHPGGRPIEISEEMISAGAKVIWTMLYETPSYDPPSDRDVAVEVYRAMEQARARPS